MEQPKLEYAPAPCPRCGAENVESACLDCRPSSDETGEQYCPTTDIVTDGQGRFLFPTAASLSRLDAWIDHQMADEQ